MSRAATEHAIRILGGPTKAARTLGLSRQTIYNWRNTGLVPIPQIILVESLTGVARETLRPDVFGAPRARPRSRGASLAA